MAFSPKTGEPYSEEEYNNYCKVMESTPAWGGQVCFSNQALHLAHQKEPKYLWRGYLIM